MDDVGIDVFEWLMLTLVCLRGLMLTLICLNGLMLMLVCLYIVYADIDIGMGLAIPHK